MTRRARLLRITLAASVATFVLAACGSSDESSSASSDTQSETPAEVSTSAPAAAEGTVVNVAVGETDVQNQYMNLDVSSVPAGAVTFAITNEGVKEHEFVVLSTDQPATQLEMNGDEANEDAYTLVDEVEEIPGGETASLSVTLEPGHYALICNLKGHYRMGMETDLTVT